MSERVYVVLNDIKRDIFGQKIKREKKKSNKINISKKKYMLKHLLTCTERVNYKHSIDVKYVYILISVPKIQPFYKIGLQPQYSIQPVG